MKRPDAAENARPKVKYVLHGGYSGLLKESFDRRTRIGRAFVAYKDALIAHLGGESNVSTPELVLIDQAARLQLMANVAWTQSHRHRNFKEDGSPVGAWDAFLRATRELRSILESLGLKRRERDIKDMADYIAAHDKHAKRLPLKRRGEVIDVDEVNE